MGCFTPCSFQIVPDHPMLFLTSDANHRNILNIFSAQLSAFCPQSASGTSSCRSGWVHRRTILEHLLPSEVLHVRVLHPAGYHAFVAQIVDVLQQHHSHHLPDRHTQPPIVRTIILRKLRLPRVPVNPLRQKDQFVAHVNETLQCNFRDGHLILPWRFDDLFY